jgi:hypothetical protein
MRGLRIWSDNHASQILLAKQEDQQNPYRLISSASDRILRLSALGARRMDEVKCPRDRRTMRWIPRLRMYFCDNDGYILSAHEAAANGLVENTTPLIAQASH